MYHKLIICIGKRRLVLEAFAEALVDLPRVLAENCGFDSPKIIAELTHIHQHANLPNFEWYASFYY
jgi:chaperonin GroEL (HSP60 family)